MSWILSLAAIFLTTAQSQAETPACDQRKVLSGPTLLSERLQTDSENCYAFVAAQLLSWELGQEVSAADISMIHNDVIDRRLGRKWKHSDLALARVPDPKDPSKTFGGGAPWQAVNLLIERGVCFEKDMPSGPYLVNMQDGQGVEIKLAAMLAQLEEVKSTWDASNPDCDRLNRQLTAVQEIMPSIDRGGLVRILSATNELEFTSRLQAQNCAGRRVPFPKGLLAVPFQGFGKTPEEINQSRVERLRKVLDQGRPVGLTADARFAGLPKERGVHAVTLTGRRPNPVTGVCEYRVLDSSPRDPCPGELYTCDLNGERWVPEPLLLTTFESLHHMSPSPTTPPVRTRSEKSRSTRKP